MIECRCAWVNLRNPLYVKYVESFAGKSSMVEPYTERTTSPVSDALSADMRRRGMKFVGSTTIYAFLQAAGFIDAHGSECDCRKAGMTVKGV